MLSIVIPIFDEKPDIEPLLREIAMTLAKTVDYEVFFVGDSDDNTPARLSNPAQEDPRIRYLQRKKKEGPASAVAEGIALAKGDIIAVMDAVPRHPPALLATLYNTIRSGADVALASRYVNGGGSEGLSLPRKIASRSIRLATQIFLKSTRTVGDPVSGYFMMRRSVIDGVTLNPVGQTILLEVLVLGKYRTVAEVPCHFDTRSTGGGEFSFKSTVQHFLHILSLVARSERDRRFFVFLMVGLSGTLIDMVLFWLITSHINDISINLAATVSASVGLVNNFLLNRNITWKNQKRENLLSQFLNYAIANGLGIGVKNVGVYIAVRAGFSGLWSNFFGIMGSSIWNFVLNDRVVFRQKKTNDNHANAKDRI